MVSPPSEADVSGAAPWGSGRTGGTGGRVCGSSRTGSDSSPSAGWLRPAVAQLPQPAAVGVVAAGRRRPDRAGPVSGAAAGTLGQQRRHGGHARQTVAGFGGACSADERHEVGGAGERARLGDGGVEAGEAGLQQRPQCGDVAVDRAGRGRHPAEPDQAVGAEHDVLRGEPAHGQAHAVRLGDALGQPPQDGADLALGHRPADEPLGQRLAVDPLVDDVGGAAGRLRIAGALRRVVDHRQGGGGQAAGGEGAADPGVRGRSGRGVHAGWRRRG